MLLDQQSGTSQSRGESVSECHFDIGHPTCRSLGLSPILIQVDQRDLERQVLPRGLCGRLQDLHRLFGLSVRIGNVRSHQRKPWIRRQFCRHRMEGRCQTRPILFIAGTSRHLVHLQRHLLFDDIDRNRCALFGQKQRDQRILVERLGWSASSRQGLGMALSNTDVERSALEQSTVNGDLLQGTVRVRVADPQHFVGLGLQVGPRVKLAAACFQRVLGRDPLLVDEQLSCIHIGEERRVGALPLKLGTQRLNLARVRFRSWLLPDQQIAKSPPQVKLF